MPSLIKSFTLAAAFTGNALAHFKLNIPTGLGFNDDKEGTGPCGSFDETARTPISNFQVGGSAIAVLSTHPSSTFFINGALLDDIKAGKNFTALEQPIFETGVGDFCLPQVKVPSEWEGKDGVIQVMQQGHDGLLYQCAAVKFTSGTEDSAPSGCKNATNLKAQFTSATPQGAAATGSASSGHSGHNASETGSETGSKTGASASSTSKPNAAAQLIVGFGSVVAAGVVALLLV